MNYQAGFFIAAMVCFILAFFKAGEVNWLPLGLTFFAAGHITLNKRTP